MPHRRPPRLAVLAAAAAVLGAGAAAQADAGRDRWVEWHRVRALTLAAEGRAAEAVEEWIAVAELLPGDRRAAARAAAALVEVVAEPPKQPRPEDPEYKVVEGLIREAVRRGAESTEPAVAYAIGRLRFADGDYRLAEDFLGTAVQRGYDPARARFWHARALISDSSRRITKGGADLDAAVERLLRLIETDPDHPDLLAARINLAMGHRLRGEHAAAEQVLLDVVKLAPWAARAHLALAETYADQGRREDALAEYAVAREAAVASDDGIYTGRDVLVAILASEAQILLRFGQLDACERTTQRLLELDKESPLGIYLLGVVELRRGHLPEAVRHLRRARRLNPGTEELSALAQALHQAGETEEGDAVLRELDEARRKAEAEKAAPPGPGR